MHPLDCAYGCGATVDEEDLESLMPWLKWAHDRVYGK